MFGFGILVSGALLTLASIGWPVYLHFRNRKNIQIQRVPSLRLFGFSKKRTKRILFEHLLLLLSRCLMLAALAILLAQPFWQSSLKLPLPEIAAKKENLQFLGIVIDDSITAMHGSMERNRLDAYKEACRQAISTINANTQVIITPMVSPYPTMPMGKDDALAFIDQLQIIPRRGDGRKALENLYRSLKGKKAAISVAASLNQQSWPEMNKKMPPLKIHFFDKSSLRKAAYIQEVRNIDGDLTIFLQGKPEDLKGQHLHMQNISGANQIYEISTHDALRGEIATKLDADQVWHFYFPDDQHPWASWYRAGSKSVSAENQVIILRDETAHSLVADQIITAVLLMGGHKGQIRHLKPAASLPDAGTLVLIGPLPLGKPFNEWLQRQLDRGIQILCLPAGQESPLAEQPPLPGWHAPRKMKANERQPIAVKNPSLLGLDDMLLDGFREWRFELYHKPQFSDAMVMLQSNSGEPLLMMKVINPRSRIWTAGFNLKVDEDIVMHALFPLLLEHILIPGAKRKQKAQNASVGDNINLNSWMQTPVIKGELITPDGEMRDVQSLTDNPSYLPINDAGFYVLKNSGTEIHQAANHPRPESNRYISHEELEKLQPQLEIKWLNELKPLPKKAYKKIAGEDDTEEEDSWYYDLTPVAILALLLFLLLEAILLFVNWKRRGAAGV